MLGETVANFIAGYDDVSKRIPDDCELEADVIVASFAKNRSSSDAVNAANGDGNKGGADGKSEKIREREESNSGKNSSSSSGKENDDSVADFTPRVCRVKDWPASGEEFGEAFPAQTLDLLKNLPMMGYTAR